MSLRETRVAYRAGPWYKSDPSELSAVLGGNLDLVPNAVGGVDLPIPGARVIIAPHAGYDYSGKCAAWAYKSFDLQAARRVFILGPSHYYPFYGCALATYTNYQTPFGHFVVDNDTIKELWETGKFAWMRRDKELQEHSLEMHLPYLWKRLNETHEGDTSRFPTIVPILVGSNNGGKEKLYGDILLPYLKDQENAFIISSDFCHWGDDYRYTNYFSLAAARRQAEQNKLEKELKSTELEAEQEDGADKELEPILVSRFTVPPGAEDKEFHESIRILDEQAMDAIESGLHDNFLSNLRRTGNTVCGRHPIGVMMAALEALNNDNPGRSRARFQKLHYARSSLVTEDAYLAALDENISPALSNKEKSDVELKGSSVSYASFYAVI